MKEKYVVIILGVLFVIGSISIILRNLDSSNVETNNRQQETAQAFKEPVVAKDLVTFTLPEQNNSGQNGSVIIKDWNGKATVKVILHVGDIEDESNPSSGDDEKEGTQPAQLRTGTCQTPGALKYKLTDVFDGSSETVFEKDLSEFESELPLILTVQKSPIDPTIIVCSEIGSITN